MNRKYGRASHMHSTVTRSISALLFTLELAEPALITAVGGVHSGDENSEAGSHAASWANQLTVGADRQ